MTALSTCLEDNIAYARKLFPITRSFDIVTRQLYLGETRGYWIGINGFCRTDVLQQIFSDLQNPLYMTDSTVQEIQRYMNTRIGYAQTSLTDNWEDIERNVLSGPSVLFIDGFDRAILLDVRTYPTRGVEEPDTERVTSGSRDGFVETLLFNTNLIRRRLRSPGLTFELTSVGTLSKSDVAIAYIDGLADPALLDQLRQCLQNLNVTALTMGSKSLEELLIPKKWFQPLPSVRSTQRPDTACSYLAEGHIAVIVDNSPAVLILPCSIFHFTQTPDDYYKTPIVGTYFRLIRFLCIPANLLLMPVFMLITVHFPALSDRLRLLSSEDLPGPTIIFYCFAVELFLDLFKYSGSLTSGRFSGSLSIVGGLLIGDIAVQLNWASPEILFYAALTLLTSLALSDMDLADGLRIYRLFLLITTAIGGIWGFSLGMLLILLSAATTPVFGGSGYFWPLFPFHYQALKTLLLRRPTFRAQPSKVWRR